MAIDNERCKELVIAFCKEYRAAQSLSYRVRQTPKELYGKYYVEEQHRGIMGAFDLPGRRCDLAAANFHDEGALFTTLKHEVLGHYATNTIGTEDKRLLLEAISRARNSPSLKEAWAFVEKHYGDAPEAIKAEEVYCVIAESVGMRPVPSKASFEGVWRTHISGSKELSSDSLAVLVDYIAEGLRRDVVMQKVLGNDELLKRVLSDAKDGQLDALLLAALRLGGVPESSAQVIARDVAKSMQTSNQQTLPAKPLAQQPVVSSPRL